MKTIIFILFMSLIVVALRAEEPFQVVKISPDIQLIRLSDQFYIHESFASTSQFGRFSSNGLLLIKNGKALMIDTPVDDDKTQQIYNYLKDSMNVKITTFIGGHFHEDCIGGMGFLKSVGVKCILGSLTHQQCISHNLPLPTLTFEKQFDFSFEGVKTECRYFGGGHTADNIVVFFPDSKIMFGGCLIKTLQTNSIGNIADAVLPEWPITVQKIKDQYTDIQYIIPGHGAFGGKELFDHTIKVALGAIETKP